MQRAALLESLRASLLGGDVGGGALFLKWNLVETSVEEICWVNLADRWGRRWVGGGCVCVCVCAGTALGWARPDAETLTYINNSHTGAPGGSAGALIIISNASQRPC